MDTDLLFCVQRARKIAQEGSIDERNDFVAWICDAIKWTSAQAFNEEARANLSALRIIYKEYLNTVDNKLEENENFYDFLKLSRKEQLQFAKFADIPSHTIDNWRQGIRTPPEWAQRALMYVYAVYSDIFGINRQITFFD